MKQINNILIRLSTINYPVARLLEPSHPPSLRLGCPSRALQLDNLSTLKASRLVEDAQRSQCREFCVIVAESLVGVAV